MNDIYLVPGLRTPFVKAGGVYAKYSSLELSVPVARAMAARARPDFMIWGQVITDPAISNIARELVLDAELDPTIPAFSTVLACSTSFMAAIEAGAMLGRGGAHLALVGGSESMSHVPLALKQSVADRLLVEFAKNPAAAAAHLGQLGPADFNLPARGWANRKSGRSMGEHTEDTVRRFNISREDQDQRALLSHQGAIKGQDEGFFDDLILPFDGVERDNLPRRDTSLERLAALKPAFGADGTITAGNASPLTDGAAALWVADREGLARLGLEPTVKLVDWELAAIDYLNGDEGMLMAPARAIPRLLARHGLGFGDIALWNVHEAFTAQVIANLRLAADMDYQKQQAGVDAKLGAFPWERVNPHGGSVSIGHPFAATGARILSQAAKELAAMPSGSRGIVSLCADGGSGTVGLLERV
ncbi:MAG TPA: acetyl-CoA C-acyltransferase [Rhodanobacter sp.]